MSNNVAKAATIAFNFYVLYWTNQRQEAYWMVGTLMAVILISGYFCLKQNSKNWEVKLMNSDDVVIMIMMIVATVSGIAWVMDTKGRFLYLIPFVLVGMFRKDFDVFLARKAKRTPSPEKIRMFLVMMNFVFLVITVILAIRHKYMS